ncbi:MAG: archease [Actinomycetota bacterium]
MRRAGRRLLSHTADVRLEAWGPTLVECLDQCVRALADVFVLAPDDAAHVRVPVGLPPGSPSELVVALLEEALYLVDVRGLVPIRGQLELDPRGLTGTLDAVALADVEQAGSVPKGIARSDLEAGETGGVWRAVVTVDV